MVAVAPHEFGHIAAPVILEGDLVSVILAGPLVERLVEDQQAHFVGQFEVFRRIRVVCEPDRVHSERFQDAVSPRDSVAEDGRPDAAEILVDVDAAQQELFPVQDEAVLRVEFNRTEAEFRSDPVGLRAGLVEELGCAGVEIRRVRRPELRVSDREGGCGAVVRGSPFSGRVVNREKHVPGERTLRRDPDMAVDLCVDDESVAQKVQRSDPPQADAAVDAAAGVPARGLLDRVVGTYRDKVFSRHERIGDVGFEAGIAARRFRIRPGSACGS